MHSYTYIRTVVVSLCFICAAGAAKSQAPGLTPLQLPPGTTVSTAGDIQGRNTAERHAWFSPVWCTGQVEFTDGRVLPEQGELLYLNLDLSSDNLYVHDQGSVVELQKRTIARFRLLDSVGVHSFVRLPGESEADFFEELTDEKAGFRLYRQRTAHLSPDDVIPATRHGVPFDDSRYYLVYPDNKTKLRFHLSGSPLRKKLSSISPVAQKFMEEHEGPVTRQVLFSLCEILNEAS